MEEKKYMDLKTDSNGLNIDASIETNEIQINIPKNKVKKNNNFNNFYTISYFNGSNIIYLFLSFFIKRFRN